ncbi:MAG: rhomboid family intramembrane serine protease [Coriobacteriia bacterium]|nr:rhomboid family intramembrane serine protease [Coriobacteriia bacterium]
MFPLRDDNPTSRPSWMTWALIAANLGVFGYQVYLLVTAGPAASDAFLVRWAFNPAHLAAAPFSPAAWLTVLTSLFMHAGFVHVGGNMLYLWIFGNNIEDRLGPWRFLAFYIACGLVATAAQTAVTGFVDVPNVGASGAVAGVLGAYLLLYPRARVLTAIFIVIIVELASLPAWLVIAVWFGLQLASGLASIGPAAQLGGVAYFAHVGGFLSGVLLIVPAWWNDRRSTRFRSWS